MIATLNAAIAARLRRGRSRQTLSTNRGQAMKQAVTKNFEMLGLRDSRKAVQAHMATLNSLEGTVIEKGAISV